LRIRLPAFASENRILIILNKYDENMTFINADVFNTGVLQRSGALSRLRQLQS
jgi:hypothetical protein